MHPDVRKRKNAPQVHESFASFFRVIRVIHTYVLCLDASLGLE